MNKLEEFYNAWIFLTKHKMFHGLFECGLYTAVVKVCPETNAVEDDSTKNTRVQIWLEHGPYDKEYQHTHDFELDCGGDTFEDAIIELARLVKEHYNDDGSHK